MLAIRLPAEIEQRLEALSKATGRTKTFYARKAILEYLDELEDVYLAEQRLGELRAGRSTTIPLEEVIKSYGLQVGPDGKLVEVTG
jgi:RHH-type rel operon transcriptional repressor/antitoxin RelB